MSRGVDRSPLIVRRFVIAACGILLTLGGCLGAFASDFSGDLSAIIGIISAVAFIVGALVIFVGATLSISGIFKWLFSVIAAERK